MCQGDCVASRNEARSSFCLLSQTPAWSPAEFWLCILSLVCCLRDQCVTVDSFFGPGEYQRKIRAKFYLGLGEWGKYSLSIESVRSPDAQLTTQNVVLGSWEHADLRSPQPPQNQEIKFGALAQVMHFPASLSVLTPTVACFSQATLRNGVGGSCLRQQATTLSSLLNWDSKPRRV